MALALERFCRAQSARLSLCNVPGLSRRNACLPLTHTRPLAGELSRKRAHGSSLTLNSGWSHGKENGDDAPMRAKGSPIYNPSRDLLHLKIEPLSSLSRQQVAFGRKDSQFQDRSQEIGNYLYLRLFLYSHDTLIQQPSQSAELRG
jgi:hypothetical protein